MERNRPHTGPFGKEPTAHGTVRHGRFGLRAAQRWASPAPLAALIDGTARWHATRIKNAPGSRTRQRRQVRAMLGGRLTETHQLCF
ncbi:MAG: hypothetical protein HGA41_03605 [Syntrophaceae bacterium]|nr:hypothetical protein [Syntrophaceae bacterium]